MNKLLAWIIGKFIGNKIKLKEDIHMDGTKKWWVSKNIWTGIVTVLIGLYGLLQVSLMPLFGITLPTIPEWVFVILGAIGIYTRSTATQKIG
jgi:predicted benzoate:H+ symporter BenE